MTFIEFWIGYALVGVSAFSAAFVWAVRARQFSDLDRARFLALKAAKQMEPEQGESKPSRADRWALLLVAVVTLIVILSAIWMGIRCLGNGTSHPGIG